MQQNVAARDARGAPLDAVRDVHAPRDAPDAPVDVDVDVDVDALHYHPADSLHYDPAHPDPFTLPRAALVAALAPLAVPAPRWENWGRTFRCTPRAIFAPRTPYHCALALALAARDARRLRPAGIGHSPSDLACTSDYMLLTTRLNRVLAVHRDAPRAAYSVTAQAGITLTDLHAALAPHALAMRNLGSISDQTLAGIVATASHGAGGAFGVLSTHVLALTLLLPCGRVVRCSRTRRPDLFTASLCGLGATGLLLSVTLELERAFRLRDAHHTIPFAALVRDLDALKLSAQHVRFWWFPALGRVRVSAASRTLEPARPAASWFWDSLVGFHAVQLLLLLTRWAAFEPLAFLSFLSFLAPLLSVLAPLLSLLSLPSLVSSPFLRPDAKPAKPTLQRLAALVHARPLAHANVWAARLACWLAGARSVAVDESHRIFNIECRYLQHTTEWALPAARAAPCLRALGAWLDREQGMRGGERPHFPIEVRFSAGDDIWLSPSSGGETCWIGIVQYKPYNLPTRYRALFAEFERILAAHGGRPHWAKAHHLDARATRALYPEVGRFLKVVEEVDPTGILRNEYIERHLMGGASDGREYKVRREPGAAGTRPPRRGSPGRWWAWPWPWPRGWGSAGAGGIQDSEDDWRVTPPGREQEMREAAALQAARDEGEDDGGESESDADSETTLASSASSFALALRGKLEDAPPHINHCSSPSTAPVTSPTSPPTLEGTPAHAAENQKPRARA
ncbi:D-arabinono-1,4-lactone oxidase-domain-containing protein [Mycena belliarum]|uniref:D-arabinono-1,4-lactone oxidase n=1 Tax=Mycena belliarum TaxID=1033014 RepID=A0AAD6XPW8_9AGAR|nr:D-arabinono-1,4-lactone oxidase-domain-containing protein [Mycena belliae]